MDTLFSIADNYGISIEYCRLPLNESISTPDDDGDIVLMDYSLLWNGPNERVHLAHEIGHCVTGSFYNRYTPLDVRQKHENRADRWAVQKLIPVDALDDAVANGYTTMWELAEFFGVTEDFMRKAVCLHTYGNIAEKIYF